MDKQELLRRVLDRLNQVTGSTEPVADAELEPAVFRRLDQAEKIISAIQQYLPRRVTDKILLNPDGVRVEGERRPVTVLFGDLSGFTAMSESLDPEQVVEVVNQYFDTMVEIAERYGGHIDKFMGDALMVLFGAPVAHEDDPLRACLAAVEMLEAMDRFSAERKMELAMSIGLNTGEVVALNVGSKGRMEYTVIGDGVNLAARLEKVATARQCVIGENTYRQVKGKIRLKKLKPVMVKGKSKPQNVYLILGRAETAETAAGLRAGSIPMIGRMAEMDSVRAAVARVRDGAGQVVAITGGPGLGKSRLAKELELLARDEKFAFVKGKCYSYSTGVAYLPFLRQLQLLLGVPESDPPARKRERLLEKLQSLDLSDFEPFLGSLLGISYPEIADLDPEKRKRKTFEGFEALYHKEAARQPLALAFEDLQWADSLSLELLEHLAGTVAGRPILICCDYRPELALPFIAQPWCISLLLAPLDRREVFQMATALAGTADVADQVLDRVAERTEGNPLFIEEIVRHLLSRRLVRREGESLVPAKRFGTMALPGTVAGVVLGRIDRLSEDLRRTLQYAAVVGREFDRETLAHIIKSPAEELQRRLDNLEHFEGLLYSKELEGRRLYQFHSTTTQEAAYGTLLKGRRLELHGAVAMTFERDFRDDLEPHLEDLAHHFSHSKYDDKAVRYLHKAGDKARGLYANSEALDYYGKGIGVLKKAGENKATVLEKAELLWAEGSILRLVGRMEEALKRCKQAARLAKDAGDLHKTHKYQLSAGIIHHVMGDISITVKLLNRVIGEAEKAKDQRILITAYTNLSNLEMRSGNPVKAIEGFEKALQLCRETGEKKETARINSSLGQVYEMMGDPAKAVEKYTVALDTSREVNFTEGVAHYNNMIGNPLMMMGDLDGAFKYFHESLRVSRKIGDKMVESLSSGSMGIINAMMGNYDQALDFFNKSSEAAIESKDINQQISIKNNIGCIYQQRGDLFKAEENHINGLSMAREASNKVEEIEIERTLAIDLGLQAKYGHSLDHIGRCLNNATELGDPRMIAYVKANQGQVMVMAGDFVGASAALMDAVGMARQAGDPEVILAAVRAVVDLNLETENFPEADQYIQRALRISEETRNKREKAYGLLALASLMLASGALDEMPGPLAEALELGRVVKDRILLTRIFLLFARKSLAQRATLEAESYLKDALEAVQSTGARELEAQAHYWKAQFYGQQERTLEQQDELSKAKKLIEDIMADIPQASRAQYRARRAIGAILE